MKHYLRQYVYESDLTDAELDEFSELVNFDNIGEDYDYAGNYVITTNVAERDDQVCDMCCGIEIKDVTLSNGTVIYFAFDYGH